MRRILTLVISIWMFNLHCSQGDSKKKVENKFTRGSFGFDLAFLQRYDSVFVLTADSGKSQIIVSPKYQGKVFTSTAEGVGGNSFGWINYKAFSAAPDPHMNAYGGENRLWIGPEGGRFSLFFNKGKSMQFENWKTPSPIDTEAWTAIKKDARSVEMEKEMVLQNYAGTPLALKVQRNITILEAPQVARLFPLAQDSSVRTVAYVTLNTIMNNGREEWNEKTGMPCIWMLDMFPPSDETTIIIPFDSTAREQKPITTTYFGEIPNDRIRILPNLILFKADGKRRGKLGVKPASASNVAASFDASSNVLTFIIFDLQNNGKYLNQEWNTSKPIFSGDAVNAYNDGPLENGNQLGPFYELESVSPAAHLKPGDSLLHRHTVIHFTGPRQRLDKIFEGFFNISLDEVTNAMKEKKKSSN